MAGTEQELRLAMRDGVELAVTLYLPDVEDPQPCLLEALPYRKDDLTSSYAGTYVRLRDEFGFAVCRVDLRGTGSSGGVARDEYPATEQRDLAAVIAWLAEQAWCNGHVGMFGTSYSGFNSLQMACERPPALGAVCAIYATDDRWTDDVHWRGGALRFVDLVDYCHYMTPMNALPPVPALWPTGEVGSDWRAEWRRRLEAHEPWVLTWLRQNRHGDYWRQGSVRLGRDGEGYDRIECPVMIVAGWADGYRNNSFRTVEWLRRAGVRHRLLAGPWAHADPATAIPGPRIDLDQEMAAWFDRWLRAGPASDEGAVDVVDVFVRRSTRPEPDLDTHDGFWIRDVWPSRGSRVAGRDLDGPRTLAVAPDVGVSAWIDCAGHLPWGLSGDQRLDDARSLTWQWPAEELTLMGHPRVRLQVSSTTPAASLAVKLCDVFPDGTSALVTRGSLDLAYRDGVHADPAALDPGRRYEVEVELDACAYSFAPGQTLRLSVAGADWPNVVAPPAPARLTVHHGDLELPLWEPGERAAPLFVPGSGASGEDPEDVEWRVVDDVLARTTTCRVRSGSTYAVPHGGTATEEYTGTVAVDRRTFAQHAVAGCTFRLAWPEAAVRVSSTMEVEVTEESYEVSVELNAWESQADDEREVARRRWRESLPR